MSKEVRTTGSDKEVVLATQKQPEFYTAEELADLLASQEERIRELEKTAGKGLQVQLEQMRQVMSQPTYVIELYKPGGRGQALAILGVSSFAGTVKITVAAPDPARPLPVPDFAG